MSKIRYVEFRPDEYISGVAGVMTAEEQGMYWLVCSLIYSNGCALDYDPRRLGALTCMTANRAKKVIKRLVELGKIEQNSGKISQKTCEKVCKKAKEKIETNRINGQKGGRPSSKNNELENHGGFSEKTLTNNHKPITNNHSKRAPKGTRLAEDAFLPDPWREFANAEGLADPDREFDRFKDYWLGVSGQKGVKQDWAATWRNWVRRSIENNPNAVKIKRGL